MAIDGDSFCPAGKRAFSLLASNALRVMAINSVGDFVLLLGKVFVVLVTVLVGIELIQVSFYYGFIKVETFCCFVNKLNIIMFNF